MKKYFFKFKIMLSLTDMTEILSMKSTESIIFFSVESYYEENTENY